MKGITTWEQCIYRSMQRPWFLEGFCHGPPYPTVESGVKTKHFLTLSWPHEHCPDHTNTVLTTPTLSWSQQRCPDHTHQIYWNSFNSCHLCFAGVPWLAYSHARVVSPLSPPTPTSLQLLLAHLADPKFSH